MARLFSALALGWLTLAAASTPARAQTSDDGNVATRDISFPSGDVSLVGTVLTPIGEESFPGVVIVHGSGPSSRDNPWTKAWANGLARRGIAVVHPDKRGCGNSGGDWRTADFGVLADDALAAVRALGETPGVDPERIGVIGFSQGGHIVPLAAERSDAVRFVVDVSGSVVPMFEQIADEIRKMGEAAGLSEAQLDTVGEINRLGCAYAVSGEGWDEYRSALETAQAGPLGGMDAIRGFPGRPDAPAWDFLRTIGNYDPMPHWRNVDVPVAFLFGRRDGNVDVAKSVGVLEETLMAERPGVSLLVFSGNAHGLFRDDALDFLARWIRDGGVD